MASKSWTGFKSLICPAFSDGGYKASKTPSFSAEVSASDLA